MYGLALEDFEDTDARNAYIIFNVVLVIWHFAQFIFCTVQSLHCEQITNNNQNQNHK